MARLFAEMIDMSMLTRAYYVNLYKDSVVEEFADKDFNQFAAPATPHIDPLLVKVDLRTSAEASRKCEEFADMNRPGISWRLVGLS